MSSPRLIQQRYQELLAERERLKTRLQEAEAKATGPDTVWIVNYGGYLHGVFASEEDATAYTERRWQCAPSNWRIEQHPVGKGAFDPADPE